MPWNIKRNFGGCRGYAVVKEDGEVVGCHKTRAEAENHMQALYASEADKNHDDDNKKKEKDFWKGLFRIVPPSDL